MINKQFDLNKFYAQSAKMSDFLKGKGHDISRTTLLHGLSVMMGEKNWNTLKPKLDLPLEPKNSKEQLLSVSNHGWVKNKDLSLGDFVTMPNGEATEVVGIYPQGKAPVNDTWDKDDIIIFNEIFNKNMLIQCVESLFKYPESYPRYNIDDIYEYKLFNEYRIYENLSIEDALLKLDDPSFLIKYLKLTDDYNDISKVHGDSLFNFNAFINGEVEKRTLIGDELFFKFSFHFDLNNSKKSNAEKLLTAILYQHALSPRNTYSKNFFVRHPLVKVNCRGNRIKLSIYSFINSDYAEQYNNGNFRLPSFFNASPFVNNDSAEHDPRFIMKTLHEQEGFIPTISLSSLNYRDVCYDMFIKN